MLDTKIYKKCFNPFFTSLRKSRGAYLKSLPTKLEKQTQKKAWKVEQRAANELWKELSGICARILRSDLLTRRRA